MLNKLYDALMSPEIRAGIRALIILIVGLIIAGALSRHLKFSRLRLHHQILFRRLVRYGVIVLTLVIAIHQLGIDLSILLGTAGILTVALGFAAQTSASNFISGLFLMAERPFAIDDVIQLGEITGRVVTIDLLSVKIKTFDNLLVRVPNETMIKANVTNLTHYPIRRVDLALNVGYDDDIDKVEQVLNDIAQRVPICLEDPKPVLIHGGFADSSIKLQFCVWSTRENFLDLRNTMYTEIKREFDRAGIDIPYPHRTIFHVTQDAAATAQPVESGE